MIAAMSSSHSFRPAMLAPKFWPSWIVVGLAWGMARLPLSWILALGRGLGTLAFSVATSRRHIAKVNLKLCFPELSDQQRTKMLKENFLHTGMGLAEATIPWMNPKRNLRQHMRINGLEHLQAAKAAGTGVVLLGGHYTCIDIACQPLGDQDMDVMYRANKNLVWEWLQVRGRRHFFDHVVERSDMRQTLRLLKSGRTLWYAPDQDYGRKHSVFAPFFNMPTATIRATSRLAKATGSQVLMVSMHRDSDCNGWSVNFSPILENFPSGDDLADASRINEMLETQIRVHPTQYLWVHRRFKTRPEGQAKVY
jgi:KDO2-lipid IV(A) lauroyltransferase